MSEQFRWRPMSEIPRAGVPIVMRGESGYMKPNDVRYEAGYYEPDRKHGNEWRTYAGDHINDAGDGLIEWCYRSELDAALERAQEASK